MVHQEGVDFMVQWIVKRPGQTFCANPVLCLKIHAFLLSTFLKRISTLCAHDEDSAIYAISTMLLCLVAAQQSRMNMTAVESPIHIVSACSVVSDTDSEVYVSACMLPSSNTALRKRSAMPPSI
jgi:hypothetical protein